MNASGRTLLAALSLAFAPAAASAQQPLQTTMPADASGWTFNLVPYIWLPAVHATFNYDLPPALGGKLPTDVNVPAAEYLPDLGIATMLAGEARYGRFSLLSDFIYMRLSANASDTQVKEVDFFGMSPVPLSREVDLGSSSTLKAALWTLAGGYTLVQEDWVNLDLMVGFRYGAIRANTDYNLNVSLAGPRNNGAVFGGAGTVSASKTVWDGIAGIRGRFMLPEPGFYIPYYFDIGAGGSKLTWQIASGLGYQTGWAGVSVMYRYLAFDASGSATLRHLALGGPMVAVNFTF
jgi:hypothetical protein